MSESPHFLHKLFEAQVKKNPKHTALIYRDQTTTYLQLEQKANQLAHCLKKMGVCSGQYIGILSERNDLAYQAVLAILKLGAVYVPLDPEFPAERVEFILTDCNASLLLTTTLQSSKYTSLPCSTFILDEKNPDWQAEPIEAPDELTLQPNAPCYVIYTSGSTGKPKGVEIAHNSVCNYVDHALKIYNLNSQDRIYQGFSLAFDASVEEIWLGLAAGGTLVTPHEKAIRAGAGLSQFLEQHTITFFSTIPTMLTMLEPPINSLKVLVVGGEVCSQELVKRWSKPGLRIINTYGPTEATVITTYSECYPDKPVTIGKPIANCEIYVLGEDLQPVASGAEGELCIGGICLSRGYINRPDLNQSKFITHPQFKRIYRSGDLCRKLPNGELQFTGRRDGQIKLRGFRIELMEIESIITEYSGISQAAVSVWSQSPGVEFLVAYLKPSEGQQIDKMALHNFVRAKLASYMTPSFYEFVEQFPLLASGKIDRKKLLPPKTTDTVFEHKNYLAPRNELEKKLADAWAKVFNAEKISINSDFFYDLGGHSLLAGKTVSQLREDPELQHVSLRDIYDHPTIEKLSTKITRDLAEHHSFEQPAKDHADAKIQKNNLRYFTCGLLQIFGCYLQFGIISWELLAFIFILKYTIDSYSLHSWQPYVAIAAFITLFPLFSAFFCIALKWLILGKVKAGVYKLWSLFYFRWWLVRQIERLFSPIRFLAGCPLFNIYCRLQGAKIGKNCYIGTVNIATFDLLAIGDNTSINQDAGINGYIVENGNLIIGTNTIGSRCFIGSRAVLEINSVMEDDSFLEDCSMLARNSTIGKGQHYFGSPAMPANQGEPIPELPNQVEKISFNKKLLHGFCYYFGFILLEIVYTAAFLPGLVLIYHYSLNLLSSIFIAAPLGGLAFMICLYSMIIILKKLFTRKIKPGTYATESGFFIRKWIIDLLMHLPEIEALAESIYAPYFWRCLGSKIGKKVEVADLPHVTPDMITIQDGGFSAGAVFAGVPRIYLGKVTYSPVVIGANTFIGNRATIPLGIQFGEKCLLGCLSIAPENEQAKKPEMAWLGSPPIFLPRREVHTGFPDKLTFNPPKYLFWIRAMIEIIRIMVPATFSFLIAIGILKCFFYLNDHYSLINLFLLLPTCSGMVFVLAGFLAIAIKWLLMGKYQPVIKPLWSVFIWKSDLLERLDNIIFSRVVLAPFMGTPFVSLFLRLMGVKIGKRLFSRP
ncbi:MAG: amino acid adenylation domain-containing protein [Proteobacteria bacterium]|nr:amino acid adenylation domain-containing protein [Pseudomonadota bacterium]